MKPKDILLRLRRIERQKAKVKQLIQNAFDELHLLETEMLLLIEELQKEVKK